MKLTETPEGKVLSFETPEDYVKWQVQLQDEWKQKLGKQELSHGEFMILLMTHIASLGIIRVESCAPFSPERLNQAVDNVMRELYGEGAVVKDDSIMVPGPSTLQ